MNLLNLSIDHIAALAFVGCLGVCLGSFANVIIARLPKGESIALPPSHCPKCKTRIRWYDNVPVFSFLCLRGRCRSCGQNISLRYPFVELIMAVVFVAIVHSQGFNWVTLEYLLLAFGLVTASFIDLDHYILPDKLTLPGMVVGLLGAVVNPERRFLDALFGFLFGAGFLWVLAYVYFLVRKTEGMGGGDIKFLGWIGAVVGMKAVPFIIFGSSILGIIVGAILSIRTKEGLKRIIPFGPFLASATLIYIIFHGEKIMQWYWEMHGL